MSSGLLLRALGILLALTAASAPGTPGYAGDRATASLGLPMAIVAPAKRPPRGSFPLVNAQHEATLWYDAHDYIGVIRAIGDLRNDIQRVTDRLPAMTSFGPADRRPVIIGTLGHSEPVDSLVAAGKLEPADVEGKWESFVITSVAHPMPGVDQALVIAGSDKRGTVYGIYELSEQLGVSPWYWWADVPPKKRAQAWILPGRYASGEPAVRYRGIFLNDEAPCLSGWTTEKFGGFNSRFYTRLFELLLRMRANYLWPAMWDNAFNEDDADNARLADEYGIVMGTSHHEPMMRAHEEWTRHRSEYGNGEWNYATNEAGLKKFFREGIARNRSYENIITIGMRGDGDKAMPTTGNLQSDIQLLERIIADQRGIIATETGENPARVPQLWALFTEVKQYYENGLRVPDDVTLLWTDDNNGSLRRLPTSDERNRTGGAGIYYHLDMHGGPFSYQWINTNPLPKIAEQMSLAHDHGADRIWIANVGDLKPLEIPTEFFLRLAWNPRAWSKEQVADYSRTWGEREFGPQHAEEIAALTALYAKYNGWRKPELITPDTFSLIHYREAERVTAAWTDLVTRAEKLYSELPHEQRDAFYQLVLHPIKACANVVEMNIAAGRSRLYARQGRASTNLQAQLVRELFRKDQSLGDYYNHTLAAGKWDHLMDQTHLGEVTWQPPRVNVMPAVAEVLIADNARYGVAIDGDPDAWPDHFGEATLPTFDSLNPQRSYVEVFAQGSGPIQFNINAARDWIRITEDPQSQPDRRFWIDIDWSHAAVGRNTGTITITGSQAPIRVNVQAVKASDQQAHEANGRFGSLLGTVAITAADAPTRVAAGGVNWETLPDYGRERAALSTFPTTAPSVDPPSSATARLEYPLFLGQSGKYEVTLVLGPVMDFVPDRGLRIAVSMDGGRPQVLDLFADRQAETFNGKNWMAHTTRDNARYIHTTLDVSSPGTHVLKISRVDAGVVLQKIILNREALRDSYFGPPAAQLRRIGLR